MARILAVDFGTKRTGLAITDPEQIIATGLETVPTSQLMDFFKGYFEKEDVAEVVFGFPTKLDKSDTNSTRHVEAAIKRFRKLFPDKPLFLHDERFTSKMALDTMIQMGTSKKARQKKKI